MRSTAVCEKAGPGGRETGVGCEGTLKSKQRHASDVSPRGKSRAGLVLLLLLLISYSYFVYRGSMWNGDSRMALVLAVVDQHTLSIDAYHQMTGDKSFFNGHYYSDKAIGVSLLAIPIYAFFKQTPLSSLPPDAYFLLRYVITFFVVSIPSSLLGLLFYSCLPTFGVRGTAQLISTLGLTLGTIAFPFSTALFGHQPAAFFLFAAFLLLRTYRAGAKIGLDKRAHLFAAAILAGYAVLTEYPAAIAVFFLSAYAILIPEARRSSVSARAAVWLVGMVPSVAIILTYNTLAFGSPFSQGYAHLGGLPYFAQGMSQGFLGLTYPKVRVLVGITLHPFRGLFFLSPFLVLAISGWKHLSRSGNRCEAYLCAAIVVSFLLFNASYFQWDGGYSLGPRHVVPALPFLALLAAGGIAHARKLGAMLVSLSVVVISLFTVTDPLAPPVYPNPLAEWAIPRVLSGSVNNNWGMLIGLTGLASLIPLLLVVVGSLALVAHASRSRTTGGRDFVANVA